MQCFSTTAPLVPTSSGQAFKAQPGRRAKRASENQIWMVCQRLEDSQPIYLVNHPQSWISSPPTRFDLDHLWAFLAAELFPCRWYEVLRTNVPPFPKLMRGVFNRLRGFSFLFYLWYHFRHKYQLLELLSGSSNINPSSKLEVLQQLQVQAPGWLYTQTPGADLTHQTPQ